MPETDLKLLVDAAKEAGRIATRFTGPTAEVWDKPDNAGPVTEADIAVNTMLFAELCGARPDYGWLSEETEDGTARLHNDRVFIIDPIDGTRGFIKGSSTWAHSLAIAEKGRIVAAVIYLPLRNKLYTAQAGRGAQLNGAPILASDRETLSGARVLAAKPNYDPKHWQGIAPDIEQHYRPSLAYRLALVAEGKYDAMLTLRNSWEWDIAAGDLILREAGAVTSDRTGAALKFNNSKPFLNGVVASGKALHKQIGLALTRDTNQKT